MKCDIKRDMTGWEKTCVGAGYPRDLLYFGKEHYAKISRLGLKRTADVIGMGGVCQFWASKNFLKIERAKRWAGDLVKRMDASKTSSAKLS